MLLLTMVGFGMLAYTIVVWSIGFFTGTIVAQDRALHREHYLPKTTMLLPREKVARVDISGKHFKR